MRNKCFELHGNVYEHRISPDEANPNGYKMSFIYIYLNFTAFWGSVLFFIEI
jgi:hypothetical protein